MTELSYGALLDRLFPRLTGGIRWGLERTRRLLSRVGDPHLAYSTIHIGGTNGKGSAAAMTEAVLHTVMPWARVASKSIAQLSVPVTHRSFSRGRRAFGVWSVASRRD